MEKVMNVMQIVGMVALALPTLISALILFFMAIPGDQPDKFMKEKLLPMIEKIVAVIEKFSKK